MSAVFPPGAPLAADTAATLYARSQGRRWGLRLEQFTATLERSCAHRFGERWRTVEPDAIINYLENLHLEDLALATACRYGSEAGWAYFMREVQPAARANARALAGEAGTELADTLVADLYGTSIRDGERRSLFDYFHGRSRLTTWLRSVIAQRHVDALRRQRREVPLESNTRSSDEAGDGSRESAARLVGPASGRAGEAHAAREADREPVLVAFEHELAKAVAQLDAGDRLRLSLYYVHGSTLAQIGRLVGEHESSVSRRLERSRRHIRETVERALREDHGLSEADLRQCYAEASRYSSLDVVALLTARSP